MYHTVLRGLPTVSVCLLALDRFRFVENIADDCRKYDKIFKFKEHKEHHRKWTSMEQSSLPRYPLRSLRDIGVCRPDGALSPLRGVPAPPWERVFHSWEFRDPFTFAPVTVDGLCRRIFIMFAAA